MKKTGIELIADERARQIAKEGWTPEHDDQHKLGELSEAAVCYVTVGSAMIRGSTADEWPPEMVNGLGDNLLSWPWDDKWWKPSNCVLTNLVKAGALIAAEIDRLLRQGSRPITQAAVELPSEAIELDRASVLRTLSFDPDDPEILWILGRPNFVCGPIAHILQAAGHLINKRAEDEQAAVIVWMIRKYQEHGVNWKTKAEDELGKIRAANQKTEA